MRVLIIGCGYVGLSLGAELVRRGHEVFGVRRSSEADQELKAMGIQPCAADISKRSDLDRLPAPFDWVVNLVSSTKGGADEYRDVYLNGTRNLIEWLSSAPPKKFVYTSSTSVYGQTDGSTVDETSPTEPLGETSKLLVATEDLLIQATRQMRLPVVILRVAGIYGPGRGHLFQQYCKGQAKISGNGQRFINMIQREDLVGIIGTVLEKGGAGGFYDAVDDEPVSQIEFFRWLSEIMGKPMPPFATDAEEAPRKRGLTNKRVSNRKLREELGYQFKYPTFREGYSAEILRMKRAGQSDGRQPSSR
jgi:nucleoside-diphosphate-sugar epimerase